MDNKLNILWASMSGTAENVANKLNEKAKSIGFNTNQLELNQVTMNDLSLMKNVAKPACCSSLSCIMCLDTAFCFFQT